MLRLAARRLALLCLGVCATVAAASVWPTASSIGTEDRNNDGRPDVWHHYNAHGQPTDVRIDTNFDGRADVHEYYERGTLVRRESDRNFDAQIDLIEEFDAAREPTRVVVDSDYDGTADLLVLFAEGRAVFSHSLRSVVAEVRHPADRSGADVSGDRRRADPGLAPLTDPFDGELSLRGPQATAPSDDGGEGDLPRALAPSPRAASRPPLPPARRVPSDRQACTLAPLSAPSPRGPPLS